MVISDFRQIFKIVMVFLIENIDFKQNFKMTLISLTAIPWNGSFSYTFDFEKKLVNLWSLRYGPRCKFRYSNEWLHP